MSDEELEKVAVFASVYGFTRFDASKVAAALRAGKLTKMEAHGLANLLEGKHPDGLRLVMKGQGKGWKPVLDGARSYERCMAIGKFVTAARGRGLTYEASIFDASEHFGISEAIVARDLRLYPDALTIEI